MPPRITVLLVDDHALVRRGFRRMLKDDPAISVVGLAKHYGSIRAVDGQGNLSLPAVKRR